MNHEPSIKLGRDKASGKKSKLGVWLFVIYTIIYAGFVAIGVSDYELFKIKIFGGQNLAVVYGFGLIILAILMGVVYNFICTKYENKMNKKEE